MWRAGMRVVCIDAEWRPSFIGEHDACPLVEGKVYTVERIHINAIGVYASPLQLGFTVELVGCPNPFDEFKTVASYGFNAGRFRPVVDEKRETDISVFTKMLKEDKHLVDA